jgi:DNA-binding response OmpR family regulator
MIERLSLVGGKIPRDHTFGWDRNHVPTSNAYSSHNLDPSEDLHDLKILLVEDSRDVGEALKQLLMLLGASVIGLAANTAEAQSLIEQCLPDVALVDFHLRGGEQSNSLVIGLREQGVQVIMLSGSIETSPVASSITLLEKPISESMLLAHLSSIARRNAN